MTAKLMLRIASLISFLFAAAHSLGGLHKWSPMGDNPVLKAMAGTHFPVMGVSRSYLDFFLGLGWTLSVFMLLQAVLLWQMASLAAANAAQVRPMIAAFALATVAIGVLAALFILPAPALFCAFLLVALVLACFARR